MYYLTIKDVLSYYFDVNINIVPLFKNTIMDQEIQIMRDIVNGRPPCYKTPKEFARAAMSYFGFSKSEVKWNKQNWVGKNGIEVTVKVTTPLTKFGLYAHTGISSRTFDRYISNYKDNKENMAPKECQIAKEFCVLAKHIEAIIRRHQIEGALTGHFNPLLVARLNGLVDKRDITTDGEKINTLGGVKVELPEGMTIENIEEAKVIEDPPLEIKKHIA